MSTHDGWDDHAVSVLYTSPGGIATVPFADGYLTVRICLGHVHIDEDGLLAEVEGKLEPVPWRNEAVRAEAIEELKRRARRAEGEDRAALVRLIKHVLRTPYYEDA